MICSWSISIHSLHFQYVYLSIRNHTNISILFINFTHHYNLIQIWIVEFCKHILVASIGLDMSKLCAKWNHRRCDKAIFCNPLCFGNLVTFIWQNLSARIRHGLQKYKRCVKLYIFFLKLHLLVRGDVHIQIFEYYHFICTLIFHMTHVGYTIILIIRTRVYTLL